MEAKCEGANKLLPVRPVSRCGWLEPRPRLARNPWRRFLIDGRDMKVHICWRLNGYQPFPVWLARAHSGGKQMEAKCAGPNRGLSVWLGPPYSVCPVLFALISSHSSFGPCQFAFPPVRLTRTSFVSHSTSPASFLIDGCDMKVHICRRSYAPPHERISAVSGPDSPGAH